MGVLRLLLSCPRLDAPLTGTKGKPVRLDRALFINVRYFHLSDYLINTIAKSGVPMPRRPALRASPTGSIRNLV